MKYIRTKYGRIEENYEEIEREIIAQSDNVEELCDEFVYVKSNGQKIIEKHLSRMNGIEIINIYGAIWTDKGLIYVAKMNDKGELELLWT